MSDIRAALNAAIDDMPAVGWADARTTDLRWEDVHAVIDATLDAADSLDAAWAEAEAALPAGWVVGAVTRNSQRGHTAAQAWFASCYRESGDPLPPTGHAGKGRYPQSRQIAYGLTPATALRALAEKLRRA